MHGDIFQNIIRILHLCSCLHSKRNFLHSRRMPLLPFMILFIVANSAAFPAKSVAEPILGADRQYIHAYGGQLSNFPLNEWGKINNMLPSYMITIGGGLDYYLYKDIISLGIEANYSSHWGKKDPYTGEISAAIMAKLHCYNITKYLPFYIGVGDGLSYAFGVPLEEKRYGYGFTPDPKQMNNPLLNFLVLEVGIPLSDKFEIFGRIHHRCTVFGLLDRYDKIGGVNYPSIGIRYYF